MRPQGAWLRIFALLALLSLVLPASANVASCMEHAKSMTCCMKQVATSTEPKAAVDKEDCCHKKAKSAKSLPSISEGKNECHCSIKSIPAQPSGEFNSTTTGNFDIAIPVVINSLPNSGQVARQTPKIFYGDSSPPDEPHGTASFGRAPPVSVL